MRKPRMHFAKKKEWAEAHAKKQPLNWSRAESHSNKPHPSGDGLQAFEFWCGRLALYSPAVARVKLRQIWRRGGSFGAERESEPPLLRNLEPRAAGALRSLAGLGRAERGRIKVERERSDRTWRRCRGANRRGRSTVEAARVHQGELGELRERGAWRGGVGERLLPTEDELGAPRQVAVPLRASRWSCSAEEAVEWTRGESGKRSVPAREWGNYLRSGSTRRRSICTQSGSRALTRVRIGGGRA